MPLICHSPLVQKLRENDKEVVGLGVKGATSVLLVENCDELRTR